MAVVSGDSMPSVGGMDAAVRLSGDDTMGGTGCRTNLTASRAPWSVSS